MAPAPRRDARARWPARVVPVNLDGVSSGAPLGVAIVGAGFSGIAAAARLDRAGFTDLVVFEAADRIGGTWRDNVYPGCACDVPSHLYALSSEPSADWDHVYARQPEILAYLERAATRLGLLDRIRLGTRIERAQWDEDAARWRLEAHDGRRFEARALVLATGPLRVPAKPALPGLEGFRGEVLHTARWREVALGGRRIAVIGTGASAIQVVPALAAVAGRLHVFQRTPPWILPRLDGRISARTQALLRRSRHLLGLWRGLLYVAQEVAGTIFFLAPSLGRWPERRALAHLRRQVADPELRERLTPRYRMGCKRVLLSNDYYPALTRSNVELVASGAARVEGTRLVAHDGTAREVDVVVLATGFDLASSAVALDVLGREGLTLKAAWRAGAEAYLGMTVAGFPNMFIMLGPNTGLGHTSVLLMVEAQARYIALCLERLRQDGLRSLEVRAGAMERFNRALRARLRRAVWSVGGCTSWYLDAEGRNLTLWPGYTWEYALRTRRPDWSSFELGPDAAGVSGGSEP